MAKKNAEAAIRSAFETLITADPDSYDMFDAEQTVLDARETHADFCAKLLDEMSADERSKVAQALATAAEVLEDEDVDDETEANVCGLAEEDITMDINTFEPEEQGTLEAQIHYAFGFMSSDPLDCTEAQETAMKFLRRQRKKNPKEFFAAFKLLADSSQRLACKIFDIDAD